MRCFIIFYCLLFFPIPALTTFSAKRKRAANSVGHLPSSLYMEFLGKETKIQNETCFTIKSHCITSSRFSFIAPPQERKTKQRLLNRLALLCTLVNLELSDTWYLMGQRYKNSIREVKTQ